MKKLLFILVSLISNILFANETNWISYDDWVTGPGSVYNKNTYLLPFGYNDTKAVYYDERPLLYETDMGWPVPDEEENNLKYLFFGDTYFFMRDSTLSHNIMSKISGGNNILDFNVENNGVEIKRRHSFSPLGGKYLNAISYDVCKQNCIKEHGSCNQEQCEIDCVGDIANRTNYSDCFSYCNSRDPLENESDIFDYLDLNLTTKADICENFCKFDLVETYASSAYFSYDGRNIPENNDKNYNNGTSNIFLAAALDTDGTGNETQYKVKFQINTGETGEASSLPWERSSQLYSKKENDPRRSKSIWKNLYEKGFEGFIGIYPRGYFYACQGAPEDSEDSCQQESKKLFVPYNVNGWDFLNQDIYCKNASSHHILSDDLIFLPVSERAKLKFDYLNKGIGTGIYDFENECRIKFSNDQQLENPFSQPRTCGTTEIEDGCYQNYPNKHILWPNLSKMSNMTVIHGLDLDILSPNDNKEYIYFMGTGEAEVDVDELVSFDCGNSNNAGDTTNDDDDDADNDNDVDHYEICNDDDDDENNDDDEDHELIHKTQKTYIARVRAYESEIKCAASYEYFAGITNGIARWEKDIDKAEPLYGFYPLQAMGAESIVKHRDLYWMTAPLNETEDSALVDDKKGFVVLASPDAFHWQKVDTILFENPERIWLDYAFFWLPPKLINDDDNTMPFLYSIWKSNSNGGKLTLSSFLNDNWNSKFTRYNLRSGKYKFMAENMTRAFLADNAEYGYLFLNTIPGKTPKGTKDIPISYFVPGKIPLPFKTFQNLENLSHAGLTSNELTTKTKELKNRYAIIEYCYCENQDEELCMDYTDGNCSPYKQFVTDRGNGEDNWKIIDISDSSFFDEYVWPCKNENENIPDYMCNIPFEHGENLPKGIRKTPVWNWWKQIAEDHPTWNKDSAKVILRFSHWQDISSEEKLPFEEPNYAEINRQLMENNKLIPYDCDGTGSSEIMKTCQDPSSWRISKQLILTYKSLFDQLIDPNIDFSLGLDPIRLEYLYPYPVMIHDYGKPGDPAPDIWDMFVADHFSREFFKVSSFEYANSSLRTLTSGAAATAVIKNGQMQIYAWGGSVSLIPRSTSLAGILYVGTYNPETEVVTFISEILDETDTNSPALTAGASMVYDDENDKIYLIGAVDQNGVSRIYRLEDARTGRKWESVATIDLGRYFRLVKKSEHEYFAFGGQTGETSFNTKVYLLDLNNMTSPRLITNIPTSGLANSFAAYSEMDQKLYIFGGQDSNGASDRFLSFDTKTATWNEINAVGGPGAGYGGVILVDYITETISLGGGVFENSKDGQFKWIFNPKDMTWTKELKSGSYCLKETGTTLQGGLEFSGECVPFTHPWYNSFSAGATVYSLDGKGDRLYVGTNNAIKVYDISDPTSPVLVSSFSTSSRVNDLEVYGNTLFAATNGGLYKLDASNDTLTQTLFVSAFLNSQYKVEVYNGKLYVGDDNGIKVRDLETLSVLTSVNNGSVLDFAIENGEIGLYKDALFSPVEIRDAETLTLKANEFFGCFEIEVGSSDGRFYLSCDDETYRFEDDGDGDISFTELSGDIRELQNVYTYNGYTYFYDENTIWISTSNDVPALCGNGIVEGDEVCDGGQIDCEELDSNYVSGTATCNSTCDGYNTNNCSDDGW